MSVLISLIALQVVLPLALLALNAVLPCRGLGEFVIRSVYGFVVVLLLAYGGVWLFPPYWWVWVVLGLHVLWMSVVGSRLRRPAEPGSAWRWVRSGVFGALAAIGMALWLPMQTGQRPAGPTVDLSMPLGPGRYLVVAGGASAAVNPHFLTLGEDPRFAEYRGQSHAVDIVGLTAIGLTGDGAMPRNPRDYAIYGAPVLSPCDGEIMVARDGLPDQQVPEMDTENMAGNHVVVDCGGFRAVMAHLAPGSLSVAEGDAVTAGQQLALVGNSGNTSQPHLHLHVQSGGTPEAPLSGEPMWFTIDGMFPTRGDRFTVSGGSGG